MCFCKARFCGNVGHEWPAVLAGSTKRGSSKGLRAAGTGGDAGDQAGEDEEEGDDGVRVTNEALRASIRKSKEVLAMHRKLLEQVSFLYFVAGIECIFRYRLF